jgi:outer membrane murein-binding lipoprotein Lpp
MMRTMSLAGAGTLIVAALLAGCATPEGAATQTDIDALRSEIADLRTRIDSVARTAEAAAQSASDAAARADESARAAAAASDKADRIYRQSLRK